MRPYRLALMPSVLFMLFGASALNAQDLADVCPNSKAGTGALWGVVQDLDAEMALPGVRVVATWQKGGNPARAETHTGLDGGFTLCYLPLETDLSVQPNLANIAGTAIGISLTELITRKDLGLSLSGTGLADEEDDRIWACFGRGESTINRQNPRLLRCDPQWQPLEQCPKEALGRVQATRIRGGVGMMREMLEKMANEARRLGANALIDWSASGSLISAQAVRIEVDPSTC